MQARVFEFLKNTDKIPQVLVCEDDKSSRIVESVVEFFNIKAFVLPDFRADFGEDLRIYHSEITQINNVLNAYYKFNNQKILIIPIKTALKKLPASKHTQGFNISFGDEITIDELKDKILHLGYEFTDIVYYNGEVSIRGDIVDIFINGSQNPVRILFDDNLVESIRLFDISTQISTKDEIENIEILPVISSFTNDNYEITLKKIEQIDSNALVKDINSLGFWAIDDFCDYLNDFDAICVEDPKNWTIDEDDFKKINIDFIKEPQYYKDFFSVLNDDFLRLNSNKKITIIASNESMLRAMDINEISQALDGMVNNINIKISDVTVNVFSQNEIIISINTHKKIAKKRKTIVIDELKIGDYVVHEEYGIGKFAGLELIKVLGSMKEFVSIIYQNDDKLLLPVENLNLIDRYISDSIAILDRLGRSSFQKLKQKVRQKLFLIAQKIIQLAAQRELLSGIKIDIEHEKLLKFMLNSGFEYTTDQQNAIEEILNELKSGKIMDRLLSADVGFGKTEVAMCACFATLISGFSAIFCVPTTILSNQHFKTLKQRFKPFDLNVFRLDRFTTPKEKKELIKAIENKEKFICVGTHSLLNLKIENLALIIIDEEHKFGVKQKEKLKQAGQNSHVLSMSATPIPRSLSMALSNIKTYSTLKTPPDIKEEVRTIVKEYDEKIIKQAISRELRRGGQVFFIHNNISTIEEAKNDILQIIPNLKILVLHSKIDDDVIEQEMINFIERKYDILLSTSIIESGIHIPNANTIIIQSSQNFGMADLHQLRGRVGRGGKEGFCYCLIDDKSSMTNEAVKRLIALESNSSIGSGALLAYQDLQIRGAGNLIGQAQSGHIESIGYSLYLRMLEDEINNLLNNTDVKYNVDLRLEIKAFINPDYISNDTLRLDLYRRLSKCSEVAQVYEISSEMENRFGRLDEFSKQFINVIIIKVLAQKQGICSISGYDNNISITYNDKQKQILKAKSKDDDDVINEILIFLRKKS